MLSSVKLLESESKIINQRIFSFKFMWIALLGSEENDCSEWKIESDLFIAVKKDFLRG